MIIRVFFLFAAVFIITSCKAPAPIIETNYQSQTIDVQLDNLTNQMVNSLAQEKKTKIAVMEFPDLHGNVSELGKFIPEELTTRFFMTRRFDVVERSLLKKVLEEQNLGMSGLVDANSAAQVGNMLGVDAIVTGTVTDMGTTIRINARIIATETASVFAVSSVSIDKDTQVMVLMGTATLPAASSPTTQTNITEPAPAEQANSEQKESANNVYAKTTLDGFEFEVVEVRQTDENHILIDVLYTNTTSTDRNIGIYGNDGRGWTTQMYDDLGQEYRADQVSIGSKSHRQRITHLFISNIPTRVTFRFSDVNPNIVSIPLLKISHAWEGRYKQDSKFTDLRNIEIH